MKAAWIIPVLIILACAGCGYQFAPGGEHIDAALQRVFIGAISNNTSEANVENYVRNAFFSRFRRGSRFTPVASMGEADVSLTGRIASITTGHLAYSSADVAKEDRVYMTLELELKRINNGEIIWMDGGLTGSEAYVVSSSTTTTATNKEEALKKLSVDMADKAYRNMMSGF